MREQKQEGGTAEPWFAGSKPSSRRAYGIIFTRSRCEFQAFIRTDGWLCHEACSPHRSRSGLGPVMSYDNKTFMIAAPSLWLFKGGYGRDLLSIFAALNQRSGDLRRRGGRGRRGPCHRTTFTLTAWRPRCVSFTSKVTRSALVSPKNPWSAMLEPWKKISSCPLDSMKP